MSESAGDSPRQVQKHRGGMFVRWNGRAKGHVSQILEGVGQCEVPRITGLPKPVALRKFLRRKRRKSQQIVGAVLDHVDSQIVSRVDAEIRPVGRSEERRVGKEGRSRWSPYH